MLFSKKTLVIGILSASLFPLSTHAMQNSHTPQKSFSKLALGQSTALCFFGAVTRQCGDDLLILIGHKETGISKRKMGTMLKGSGQISIGLGLLSAAYILISQYKITQRQNNLAI